MTALAFNQRMCLVLNRDWVAIHIWPMERAIRKLSSHYANGDPKAIVIDPNQNFEEFTWDDWTKIRPEPGQDCLRGNRINLMVPKIVKVRYDKPAHERATFSRRRLYKRDKYRCQYCGVKPGSEELTIDHIKPQSKGGPTTWDNCCLACVECNGKKANRTLKEAGMKFYYKGFEPVKPKWTLFKNDGEYYRYHYKEWEHFVSDMYWDVELDNEE